MLRFLSLFVVVLLLGGGMVACVGDDNTGERLVDMEILLAESGEMFCKPVEGGRVRVLPGEAVRFRVYNRINQRMEFIVTDEEGYELRSEKPLPGLRVVGPDEIGMGTVGGAAVGEVATGGASVGGTAGEFAHEGHEDEAWEDKSAYQDGSFEYSYRMLIQENGVRNELVTFPDTTEDYVLTRYLCAHPDCPETDTAESSSSWCPAPLANVYAGEITRR